MRCLNRAPALPVRCQTTLFNETITPTLARLQQFRRCTNVKFRRILLTCAASSHIAVQPFPTGLNDLLPTHCCGCGVKLQQDDKNTQGYVVAPALSYLYLITHDCLCPTASRQASASLCSTTCTCRYFITPKKLREAYDKGEVTKTRVDEIRSKTVKATLSAEPQRETVVMAGETDAADLDELVESWDVRSSQLQACMYSAYTFEHAHWRVYANNQLRSTHLHRNPPRSTS